RNDTAPPALRYALETNKDSRITFEKPVQFDPKLPNWCLEISFLCRKAPDGKNHQGLLGVSPGPGGPTFLLNRTDARFESMAQGLFNAIFPANKPTPLGERMHAAVVREGKDIRLFINGELQSTRQLTKDNYGHAGNLTIGGPNFLTGEL